MHTSGIDYKDALYIRHSDDMIDKLKSAGLGFFVRESESQQKLG